jgi:DNA-binding PadR family transcriptional regulator
MSSFQKFRDRKLDLILAFPSGSFSQKEMQEKSNFSKGYVSKWLNDLEKEGILIKIGISRPQFWQVTEKGKQTLEANVSYPSLSMSAKAFRLHNFSVELPILRDNSTGFWEKSWDMNGWKKQFKRLQDVGVSVERTPRTLTINFQPQSCGEERVFPLAMAGTVAVMGYLAKQGIELDLFSARISRQEYGSPEPLVQAQTEKGMTFRQSLDRPQEVILPNDKPKEAFVWFDSSVGPERDTNDLAHMRNTALMPERVERLETSLSGLQPFLEAYTEQIKVHLEVMNGISKMVKKLNKRLDQKSLKEFL